MEETTYKIKTTNFEGPLEVLLGLIEKRKLFINEISLAGITDDFIVYVQSLDKKNLDTYASFITVAATLILIKSRSLIPNLPLTVDEEKDVSNLEHRLELYKLVKEISVLVLAKFAKKIIFPRLEKKIEMWVFTPDKNINIASMHLGIKDVLKAMPVEPVAKPEVFVMKIRTLEETINDIVERVSGSIKISFSQFTCDIEGDEKYKKVSVIVNFLAMLELIRSGFMDAFQENSFDDINLEKLEVTSEVNI